MSIGDIEFTKTNICSICKYQHKCLKYMSIYQALHNFEVKCFDEWNLDVDIDFIVGDCPKHVPDFDLIQLLHESEIGEDDDFDEED